MQGVNQLQIKATPVFFANEKAYREGWPVICNEGGSRCFDADTMVITETGSKRISDITVGEYVLTPTGRKMVSQVHEMANSKPCYEITLRNGCKIKCTQDHKFFYNGRWVEIKDLVSLWNERNT